MGLDMYLTKKTYVKNWDHMRPEEKHRISVKLGGKKHPYIKPKRISYIIEEVAYWRKANAIHQWFVEHVQKGMDDCGDYYVDLEVLRELVDTCKSVLASIEVHKGKVRNGAILEPDGWRDIIEDGEVVSESSATLAQRLLPTQDGFFFGSTDYNQYYVQDLRETVEQLEPLLREEGCSDFYYHSSW